MPPRFTSVLAFLVPAVAVLLVLAQPLGAGWKILYYDKDGRITGVDGGANPDSKAAPSNTPTVKPTAEDSALVRELSALPPGQRFEPDEIIISDPPEGFERRARQLGFSVIEKVSLRAEGS